MTKKIKKSEQSQRTRRTLEQAQAARTDTDVSHLLAVMERNEAEHAGLSLEQWRALPEAEQIRRSEDAEDSRFAEPQHLTLSEYRVRSRERFEAGGFRPEYGMPMWLRSEYAQENPQKIANELAQLVSHGMTASGEILKQTIAAMECRTRSGWLGTGLGFAELKLRVEEEVDRLGLREQFNQALANLEGTIQ